MDNAHEIFYRLHCNDVGENGKPLLPGVDDLLGEIDMVRDKRDEAMTALANIVVAIEREDSPAFRGSHYSDEDLTLLEQATKALGEVGQ